MPEYLSPGVYVEEVSSGLKPIEGVGTSTGAFIGYAERGPVETPTLVTNWTKFKDTFGEFHENAYLAYAIYQFFNEGGTKCYVLRCGKAEEKQEEKEWKFSAATIAFETNGLTVNANSPGIWGNNLRIKIEDPSDPSLGEKEFFNLSVFYNDQPVEAFKNLSMIDASNGHIAKRVTSETSKWISVSDDGDARPPNNSENKAVDIDIKEKGYKLYAGEDWGPLDSADWSRVIKKFDHVDDINILAIPDALGDPQAIRDASTYCETRRDCFFVADSPLGKDVTSIKGYREGTAGNTAAFNSSYAALYYPWIAVPDPLTKMTKLVPPSGAVVGTYSHTDVVRGVHKAPAGIEDGYLNTATGVEYVMSKGEHDVLNPAGINAIRSFPGSGNVIWGARTLSNDSEWRYVNVRRLFIFLEESIQKGTQWVVFEPNSPMLWGKVKRNITAFLTRVWRDGALFGTTADEAFYVRVDAENNPQSVIDAGQLVIEVGVAPVKPAEFVIIRISQKILDI